MIKRLFKQYSSYLRDFGLAFISSLIATVVTTLVVNPVLAKTYSLAEYGNILTICGYIAIMSAAVGNSLNNVRLLDPNNAKGVVINNYNVLLLVFSAVGVLIIFALSAFYTRFSAVETALLCLYALLTTVSLYFMVSYRIVINYWHNLIYNAVVCAGYLAGLGLALWVDCWPLVYVAGQLAGLVYLLFTTKLPREKLRTDHEFPQVLKKFILLAGTTLFAQLISLLDRVLLHPLVGEEAVSLYSTAAFFGKSVNMLFGPIAFVLLSYFVKDGFVMTRKLFHRISAIGLAVTVAFFLISLPLAPVLTRLLYPTIFEQASPYIVAANISYMISAISVLLNPIVLKTCHMRWQMIIQVGYGAVYIVLGIVAASLYGVMGFAYASILANTVRTLILFILSENSAQTKTKLKGV